MGLLNKFPSYYYILNGAVATFKRFPFALICAIHGTIVAIILIGSPNIEHEFVLQKLLMVFGLALPLYIALTILAEKNKLSSVKNIVIQFAGAAILVLYYLSLPKDPFSAYIFPIRYLLLQIGLHSLVAFAPFLGKNGMNGFWQFNKSLFLRLLLTILYSGVMYTGLAIALAAADYLFGVEIKPERYMQLWIIMAGLFHTWLFLAGIPKNLDELNNMEDYPKGLKVFTQYILLPLVVLYFVILIAYEAKILATWNLPKGWVSELILWYAIVGMLSLLLLYPLKEKSENLWIQVYIKWFFRALVPLVVMLFLAIGQRISQYGITENRYFVLIMAISLSIVTLYFIFSKTKDIRIIPILLCLAAFISTYGPQSAFTISKNSQQGRLNDLLLKSGLLVDNQLVEPTAIIDLEDQKDMSSIVEYLNGWHGTLPFSIWLDDSMIVSLDSVADYNRTERIAHFLGFQYVSRWQANMTDFFYLSSDNKIEYNISDYDFMCSFNLSSLINQESMDSSVFDTISIQYNRDTVGLRILLNTDSVITIDIPLEELITDLRNSYNTQNILSEKMIIHKSGEHYKLAAIFNNITGSRETDNINLTDLRGILLIGIRE
ncbi:MAG: DUF4153 domain-containing protein [Candidatus Zixiibacteriota bacterium]